MEKNNLTCYNKASVQNRLADCPCHKHKLATCNPCENNPKCGSVKNTLRTQPWIWLLLSQVEERKVSQESCLSQKAVRWTRTARQGSTTNTTADSVDLWRACLTELNTLGTRRDTLSPSLSSGTKDPIETRTQETSTESLTVRFWLRSYLQN